MTQSAGRPRQLRAKTKNCHRYGHPEIGFDWESPVVPSQVKWLIDHLETTVAEGEVYKPNETLQIGWSTTIIRDGGSGLTITEPDWSGRMPPTYVDSVTHALSDLARQVSVLDSVGLRDEDDFPQFEDIGLVCKNIGKTGYWHPVMGRLPKSEGNSGWYLLCNDNDHHHPKSLEAPELIPLYEMACLAPDTAQYLALPVGMTVYFGGNGEIEMARDGVELPIQPGSYLDRLSETIRNGLQSVPKGEHQKRLKGKKSE
jgi:hypothetical protein